MRYRKTKENIRRLKRLRMKENDILDDSFLGVRNFVMHKIIYGECFFSSDQSQHKCCNKKSNKQRRYQ